MEPVAGHRRRKSSLISPVGGYNAPPTRTLAPGSRNPSPAIPEQPSDGLDDAASSVHDRADSGRDSFSDEDLHDDEETGLTANERTRKQKKRLRNTLLDQRIAREKKSLADDGSDSDKSIVHMLMINTGLILLWYLFSLSISLVRSRAYMHAPFSAGRKSSLTLYLAVQQMDVRQRPPQLCLSAIHDFDPYACSVLPFLDCLVYGPFFTA